MVRTSAISALAAALAMLASAYAQSTGTPPATEYNPQQNIPRYAAEIPPGPDNSLTNQNTVPARSRAHDAGHGFAGTTAALRCANPTIER